MAQYYDLKDVLSRVNNRGRWTVTELEKAVEEISEKLGEWFTMAWDDANYLHVWGFHEEKLDPEAVRTRLPYIERMVKEITKRHYRQQVSNETRTHTNNHTTQGKHHQPTPCW